MTRLFQVCLISTIALLIIIFDCIDLASAMLSNQFDSMNSQTTQTNTFNIENIYVVNSISDNSDQLPGDNICSDEQGLCTLRAAIEESNSTEGLDTISFNISGIGPHTIQPITTLPTITDPVIIDGYTQPGTTPNSIPAKSGLNSLLKIEIDGSQLEGAAAITRSCLIIESGSSTVRGLVINRCSYGIALNGNGNNRIEGNFIGTDVTGMTSIPNFLAINIGASNNEIGGALPSSRNLISGNDRGIELNGGGHNIIQGNLLGTNKEGDGNLGHDFYSIRLNGSSYNTIAENIVANDNTGGIIIWEHSPGNLISENIVRSNKIQDGIAIIGPDVANNQIISNIITANDRNGINLARIETFTVTNNIIISNGDNGITLGDAWNGHIISNFIGIDMVGNEAGNSGNGIYLTESSQNRIGDPANTIAFNGKAGIRMEIGTGNTIINNKVYQNQDLGIDLDGDGVTFNDLGDIDNGSNTLQNFPTLNSASKISQTITGTLHSTPNSTYKIQFFSNTMCDETGYGEGENYLGELQVVTDNDGRADFVVSFPNIISTGPFVTATATDFFHNTSEFSRCILYDQRDVYLPVCNHNYCADFFDDFSNEISGWPTGEDNYVRTEYLNGEYRILSKQGGYLFFFLAPTCERERYSVEVDARWQGTPGNSYGIIFGNSGNFDNYYLFDLNTDYQQFRLYRRDTSGFTEIVTPTYSGAIKDGNLSNNMMVIRDGNAISLVINGEIIGTWYDSAISGLTSAGLVSSSYINIPTSDARFDNFSMISLNNNSSVVTSGDVDTIGIKQETVDNMKPIFIDRGWYVVESIDIDWP